MSEAVQLGDFRHFLFLLAIAWAAHVLLQPRATRVWPLVFAVWVTGYWGLGLARPYGYTHDPELTVLACRLHVAASLGDPAAALLAGSVAKPTVASRLVAAGVPPEVLLTAWRFAPTLALLTLIALPLSLLPRSKEPETAACLLVAFAWADLDLVHGAAIGPLSWHSPRTVLIALLAFAVTLALESRWSFRARTLLLTVAVVVLAMGSPSASPPMPERVFDLLGSSLPLATLLVIFERRIPAGAVLGALAAALSGPLDASAGAILCRSSLLVGLAPLAIRLAAWLSEGLSVLLVPAARPERRATAIIVLASVPFGSVFWWRPSSLDPLYGLSRQPTSEALGDAGSEVARLVEPDSSVLTSPELVPVVTCKAGRRVLRAPGLETALDEDQRATVEFMALRGKATARQLERYRLTHVLVAPWSFTAPGQPDVSQLPNRPGYSLLWEGKGGLRLYRVEAAASARPTGPATTP